jgi:2-methylcitrate dehydratase PrpD
MTHGDVLPLTSAVLANASFVHGLDFDDTHTESITHASACVVPAALAAGEKQHADGKSVLTAAVAGYETMTRIGLASPGGFHKHGYHATPICGTFAAGVIAGKLMGLSKEALTNLLGICGSQAAGLQAFLDDGSWTKRLHAGWAAHSGVVAAQLALRGFIGPKTVIEGRYGLLASHFGPGEFDSERILHNLGEVWESNRISLKPYPVCHFSHASMDSARALVKEHHIVSPVLITPSFRVCLCLVVIILITRIQHNYLLMQPMIFSVHLTCRKNFRECTPVERFFMRSLEKALTTRKPVHHW